MFHVERFFNLYEFAKSPNVPRGTLQHVSEPHEFVLNLPGIHKGDPVAALLPETT
jgi:hypothetical protein